MVTAGNVSGPVYILQTWYVPHHHRTLVYRIECGPRYSPVRIITPELTFHTDNREVYADAMDCERLPVQVMVSWHPADGLKVIDRMEPAPGWRAEDEQR